MRRSLAIAGAAAVVCAAAGTPLHAQGSSVDQHSACMSGRVGAGVASPCADASGVYFSPAGLAFQGSAAALGVTLVRAGSTFTYDAGRATPGESNPVTRDTEVIPVPHGFVSYKVRPNVAAALGVFAPYGLGLAWPVCPVDEPGCAETNFEGRYTGYDNSLRSLYVQPTVSVALSDAVALGVGLDYVHLTLDVLQRADAPQLGLRGVDIANADLGGSGNGFTGHVSALVRLSERASLGVRYLHSTEVELEGDADFTQIPTGTVFDAALAPQFAEGQRLSDQPISTTITLPAQFVAGISYRPIEPLNLLFDYQWTGWSSFDQFDILFEGSEDTTVLNLNYRDANTFRLAAEYGLSDALALRAGFRYNTAATPRATPFLPEGERNYYTVGVGYRFTRSLAADFSFQYINQPDRRGAVRPGGQSVGVYESTGQTFGFTLSYQFGGNDVPR